GSSCSTDTLRLTQVRRISWVRRVGRSEHGWSGLLVIAVSGRPLFGRTPPSAALRGMGRKRPVPRGAGLFCCTSAHGDGRLVPTRSGVAEAAVARAGPRTEKRHRANGAF